MRAERENRKRIQKAMGGREHMKAMNLVGLSILMMTALVGCGTKSVCETVGCQQPTESADQYCEPTYSFEPPREFYQLECTRFCGQARQNCKEEIATKKETCEHYNRMVRLEFGRCVSLGGTNCYNTVAPPNDCSVEDPDQKCEPDYRFCYQNCGGKVINSCDKETGSGSADGANSAGAAKRY
jgi:hypothetical protein